MSNLGNSRFMERTSTNLERSHPLPHVFISRNRYPSLTCLVLLEFLLLKYVGNKLNRPARLDPIADPITSITIG